MEGRGAGRRENDGNEKRSVVRWARREIRAGRRISVGCGGIGDDGEGQAGGQALTCFACFFSYFSSFLQVGAKVSVLLGVFLFLFLFVSAFAVLLHVVFLLLIFGGLG